MAIELLPGVEGVQSVHLDELMTLWDAWFPGSEFLKDNRGLNKDHIRLLKEAHGHWPPIQLVSFRDNERIVASNYQALEAFAVVDGRHRWAAARGLKYKVIQAEVRTFNSIEQVINFALLANRNHGYASPPRLRMAHAVWMHEQYGDTMTLEEIAFTAGVTVYALKKRLHKEEGLGEEASGDSTQLPINSFAVNLYNSLSNLREFSEQNGLFGTTDGDDDNAQYVMSFISSILKQLPSIERGDMYTFINTIMGILGKVRN